MLFLRELYSQISGKPLAWIEVKPGRIIYRYFNRHPDGKKLFSNFVVLGYESLAAWNTFNVTVKEDGSVEATNDSYEKHKISLGWVIPPTPKEKSLDSLIEETNELTSKINKIYKS